MIISRGVPTADRSAAARLYWQAFGGKLGRVMGPDARALAYIGRAMRSDHALTAHDATGRLIGIVGFKTPDGAFVEGGLADMRAAYGTIGALWRAVPLALLDRDIDNARFLMDGICVHPDARGQGVGTALLDAICGEARQRGYSHVRLDVIDRNTRARALYQRLGFVPVATQTMGPLRHIFGFASSTTMVKTL
ncbi:GNAT family N-acetyltransferase [Loktanella sp. SALINAS62]|uniref:GNAT family N-acetyltransferase n=1 Tax=Loktanella sp. SALINAS62 TaxID=2706124 RepID=UPI001B8D6759|nr:GNAT family N-acetyltransferase [Loktanella sp. SALINAS62]